MSSSASQALIYAQSFGPKFGAEKTERFFYGSLESHSLSRLHLIYMDSFKLEQQSMYLVNERLFDSIRRIAHTAPVLGWLAKREVRGGRARSNYARTQGRRGEKRAPIEGAKGRGDTL